MKWLALLLLLVVRPAVAAEPTEWQTARLLEEAGLDPGYTGVAVLGLRGWDGRYEGVNRRAVYDDLVVVYDVGRGEEVGRWAFNADPTGSGFNRRRGRYYAVLEPGLYWYVRGLHKGRVPGLRQAPGVLGNVDVLRDDGRYSAGQFGINFHPAGRTATGSDACQTLAPGAWTEFRQAVYEREHGPLPYLLVDVTRSRLPQPEVLPIAPIWPYALPAPVQVPGPVRSRDPALALQDRRRGPHRPPRGVAYARV